MSETFEPLQIKPRGLANDRDEFIRHLASRYQTGLADRDHVLQGIAEFDALAVSKRMRLYSVLATIAAAIAAISSAVTAYFAYIGLHH